MRKMSAALLFLLMLGCSEPGSPLASSTDLGNGDTYKAELAHLIERSDKIVLTEHSYPFDLFDMTANKSLIANEVVYGTRVLTAEQRARFASEVRDLDGKSQDAFSACLFEPHHRIAFYSKGRTLSTMEICFKCSQIEWESKSKIPPWAIYEGLASFIKSVGLQPEQDWEARARVAVERRR